MTYRSPKIELEIVKNNQALTPFAGLFPVIELWNALKIPQVIDASLAVRRNMGYKDSEHLLSLVLLNLSGGEAVEHLKFLKEKFELKNFPVPLSFPSPTASRDYASRFHDESEDGKRGQGRSFVPEPNKHLKGFEEVHRHLLRCAWLASPQREITLDQDATFIKTNASGALFNYKGQRSYEALNLYCPEYDLIAATEFRDGNVSPGTGQLAQLEQTLASLPEGVKKVKFRSDSAGYQMELMRFCAEGRDERFGVIDFAISCPMYAELKKAVKAVPTGEWSPLQGNQEWAEVAYAPNSLSCSKKGPAYRYLVVREPFAMDVNRRKATALSEDSPQCEQLLLPGMLEYLEQENGNLKKLHLTELNGRVYKVFAIVANILDMEGGALIHWQRERCGKSEEMHRILKEDLAGGHVLSWKFGANAFWWNAAVLSLSVHSILKRQLLPESCASYRPKTLRFVFYTMVGRFVRRARRMVLRVQDGMGARLLDGAFDRLRGWKLGLSPG